MDQPAHFKGKDALSHVIDARKKGKLAMEETHGAPIPGHVTAFCDSAKEIALLTFLLSLFTNPFLTFTVFCFGYLIWKTGRSAILGYARLERLHRVVEEERFEIEHNREQEREELKALYKAKGFSGKMLDDVINTLMADDNRLLQIMLEEEIGLDFECIEHPLKQAFGAFLGVITGSVLMFLGFYFFHLYGLIAASILIVGTCSFYSAKKEKNKKLDSVIWNMGLYFLAFLSSYFLYAWILS